MIFSDKVDSFVTAINPEKGLRRMAARRTLDIMSGDGSSSGVPQEKMKVTNSGYSESGASHRKKSMKGWQAWSSSPQADIDMNLDTLRQRSRDSYMGNALARSAINTPRTNVVGSGLRLKCRPDYEFLGITREEADAWKRHTEREFDLWAGSKFCDTLRLNDFYELQSILFVSALLNGDGWSVMKQEKIETYFPYSLRIHLIEADRVSTPGTGGISPMFYTEAKNEKTGNRIISGVEIDASGRVVAYHIANQYYSDPANPSSLPKWTRVEAYGEKTGRPNILQIMEAERCEQYRGVPYLAPVLEYLKQISRYTEAELNSAIILSFFTIFLKEGAIPVDGLGLEEAISPEEKVDLDPNAFELGSGTMNLLPHGYDISVADPKRPSSNFDSFVTAMARHIGAALEIPYELLLKNFTASYSASRAALLEAWKSFRMRRTWFASDFCQPTYELWLSEAIARGRIKAPGFFNDPLIAKAWSKAEWNGPAPGQLDPVKEVNAAKLRVENGFSTHEKETVELTGGDFASNVEQLLREKELMKDLMPATSPVQPAREEVQNE